VSAAVDGVPAAIVHGRWDEPETGRWRLQGGIQLEPGVHQLQVQAADSAGNIGLSQEIAVQVAEGYGTISVIVMSRPSADETIFVVRSTTEQRVSLGVYTVTGRPVIRMEESTTPPSDSSLRWNRRDGDGDRVANGVYLYRLSTESGISVRGSFAVVR
jgi:hypothetical protein